MNAKPPRLKQAYPQAPWRIQTQRGAILLIAVFLVVSVLWVMLSVTVQAGTAGLEIQRLEDDREDVQRQIADLRTQYANLTSANRMAERAAEMGFEVVQPGDISYIVVPGYTGRRSNLQSLPPSTETERRTLIKPVFTQSLWEWLLQGILSINEKSGSTTGGSP